MHFYQQTHAVTYKCEISEKNACYISVPCILSISFFRFKNALTASGFTVFSSFLGAFTWVEYPIFYIYKTIYENYFNIHSINMNFACIFVFCCILILLSQQSDQSTITSLLRSCRSPVYHTKMDESR